MSLKVILATVVTTRAKMRPFYFRDTILTTLRSFLNCTFLLDPCLSREKHVKHDLNKNEVDAYEINNNVFIGIELTASVHDKILAILLAKKKKREKKLLL